MKRTFIYMGCLLMAAGAVATSCSEDETAELFIRETWRWLFRTRHAN